MMNADAAPKRDQIHLRLSQVMRADISRHDPFKFDFSAVFLNTIGTGDIGMRKRKFSINFEVASSDREGTLQRN